MDLFRKKFTILVVCKANITRSAYLHGYMKHYLKTHFPHAQRKIRILSAGIQALRGLSASQVIRHIAKTHGFNLSQHNSKPFSRRLVKNTDVILVMEQYQKDAILDYFPEAQGKTFRIMEYLWDGDPANIRDIPDPTGLDTVEYQEFIETAHAETERIFRELVREGVI